MGNGNNKKKVPSNLPVKPNTESPMPQVLPAHTAAPTVPEIPDKISTPKLAPDPSDDEASLLSVDGQSAVLSILEETDGDKNYNLISGQVGDIGEGSFANSMISAPEENKNAEKFRPNSNVDGHSRSSNVTPSPKKQLAHCPFCDHCQRALSRKARTTPLPEWLRHKPDGEYIKINMDAYDDEEMKAKGLKNIGFLQSGKSNLKTKDLAEADEFAQRKTAVAKLSPRITPTHTPFPNYHSMQILDRRLNKPFTKTLYEDKTVL